MKRRHFLATAGTVGIATTVAGGTVASSAFSSLNATVLLQEFHPEVKSVYHHFASQVQLNTDGMGLDSKYISRSVLPSRIISQEPQRIVYKNQSGQYVSLSVVNGEKRIQLANEL